MRRTAGNVRTLRARARGGEGVEPMARFRRNRLSVHAPRPTFPRPYSVVVSAFGVIDRIIRSFSS